MRLILVTLFAALTLSSQCYAEAVEDTSRYDFVRELVETHQEEERANLELAAISKGADSWQEVMMSIIRNGTRTRMKLNATIGRLQRKRLTDKKFDMLIPYLTKMYTRKIELYDEMVQAAQTILAGPKPGVDYGKLAGHMPEITAQVEFVDESIFKIVPMVVILIVSDKPDSENHLSHFSITHKQAQDLLSTLQTGFGQSLDAKEQNWTTSSASVMRTYLRDKGFKYSDASWK